MFTNVAFEARKTLSGVAAAVVVAIGMVGLDQGHLAAAPAGTIEVGDPMPIEAGMIAMLPEITVTASRLNDVAQFAMLPEITVTASRLTDEPASAQAQVAAAPGALAVAQRAAALVADVGAPAKAGRKVSALLK